MVDETTIESGSGTPRATGPTSLRREKPIIEGKVASEEKTAQETAGPDAEAGAPVWQKSPGAPAAAGETALEPSVQSEAEAGEEIPAATARDDGPRRSAPLWPIAAAVVIGTALAVGGAYLLRSLDTTPDDLAALASRQAELATRLAALEKKPDGGAGLREALAAQDKRLAAVEASARDATAAAKSAQDAASEAIAASQAVGAARADATPSGEQPPQAQPPAQQSPPVDLSPLTARIGDLDQRLGTLDDKLTKLSAPLPPKNEMRLAEDSAVQPAAHIEAEAAAIIAESLVGKVERGAPFAAELSALASRGADKDGLARLEPLAAKGVATRHALAAQFSALSPALLAIEPTKPEGSFFDRMVQHAANLVRIRKVGDLSGDELPARVGRINAALQAGGVEDALAEWNDLPPAAKAKSQAFADAAKLRVEALTAARALETDTVTALAKSRS